MLLGTRCSASACNPINVLKNDETTTMSTKANKMLREGKNESVRTMAFAIPMYIPTLNYITWCALNIGSEFSLQ